jgi:hypothetical protein
MTLVMKSEKLSTILQIAVCIKNCTFVCFLPFSTLFALDCAGNCKMIIGIPHVGKEIGHLQYNCFTMMIADIELIEFRNLESK